MPIWSGQRVHAWRPAWRPAFHQWGFPWCLLVCGEVAGRVYGEVPGVGLPPPPGRHPAPIRVTGRPPSVPCGSHLASLSTYRCIRPPNSPPAMLNLRLHVLAWKTPLVYATLPLPSNVPFSLRGAADLHRLWISDSRWGPLWRVKCCLRTGVGSMDRMCSSMDRSTSMPPQLITLEQYAGRFLTSPQSDIFLM